MIWFLGFISGALSALVAYMIYDIRKDKKGPLE